MNYCREGLLLVPAPVLATRNDQGTRHSRRGHRSLFEGRQRQPVASVWNIEQKAMIADVVMAAGGAAR